MLKHLTNVKCIAVIHFTIQTHCNIISDHTHTKTHQTPTRNDQELQIHCLHSVLGDQVQAHSFSTREPSPHHELEGGLSSEVVLARVNDWLNVAGVDKEKGTFQVTPVLLLAKRS